MYRTSILFRLLRRCVAAALFPLALLAAEPAAAAEIIGVARPIGAAAAPDRAALHLQLLDVTEPDAPARIIAEVTFNPVSLIDIPFRLTYDPAAISTDRAYAVYGRLIRDGATVFSSRSNVPALTRGAPDFIELPMLPVAAPAAHGPGLLGGVWTEGDGATMRFYEDGSVGGATACNTWRGGVTIEGEAMRFGHTMQTQMACPEAMMEAERRFLAKLPEIRSHRLEGGVLTLLDGKGVTVMSLTREN